MAYKDMEFITIAQDAFWIFLRDCEEEQPWDTHTEMQVLTFKQGMKLWNVSSLQ